MAQTVASQVRAQAFVFELGAPEEAANESKNGRHQQHDNPEAKVVYPLLQLSDGGGFVMPLPRHRLTVGHVRADVAGGS